MLRKIVLILVTLFPVSVLASGWATENGSAQITSLQIEGGIVKVNFTATDSNDPDRCGNSGAVILQDDSKNGDRQYSALMAAKISKTPIRIWVSGCIDRWSTSFPKLWSVILTE